MPGVSRRSRLRDALQYLVCLCCATVVTFALRAAQVNATTAALTFLLVVLGAATVLGLTKATVTALLCVLALNYFFMPPVGTLTIQDPQNWVAFAAFLVAAITASQLSSRAQRKAAEAKTRQLETDQLYDLSRAILVTASSAQMVPEALAQIVRIFNLENAQFHGPEDGSPQASQTQRATIHDGWVLVPVQLGGKSIGTLALLGKKGQQLSDAVSGAVASLVAIAIERRSALESMASAEASRRSEQLRSALLDGLAHDLKTPLTAIKTSITVLLARKAKLDATAYEFVEIIHEEAERIQRTVDEALEAGRVESGAFALRRIEVDVWELMREVTEYRTTYRTRVRVCYPADPALIEVDSDLVKLALRQVLDNAMRYSPEDAPVDVMGSVLADEAAIEIRDYGPGVAEHERGKIFEKFYRGTAGKEMASGSGLGLAVASRVIEAHGGTIAVKQAAGGGSVFEIRFRLAKT